MAAAKRSGRRRPPQPTWRRQWPLLATLAAMAVIVAAIAYLATHGSSPAPAPPSVSSTVIAEVTTSNPAVIAAVGNGGLSNPFKRAGSLAPLQDSSGKPELLYVGAEFCPFCAAERWSLVQALARFGTFQGLTLTTSSSTDAFPDTPTFSFRSATYQSSVVAFTAVETEDRQGHPLQQLTTSQKAVAASLDSQGSIPFVDAGNRYSEVGAGYQPDVLNGLTWEQIAGQLNDPNSKVTKAIVGNANYVTAAICRLTGDQPAGACSVPAVAALEATLG
jgi:hypothetical protein